MEMKEDSARHGSQLRIEVAELNDVRLMGRDKQLRSTVRTTCHRRSRQAPVVQLTSKSRLVSGPQGMCLAVGRNSDDREHTSAETG